MSSEPLEVMTFCETYTNIWEAGEGSQPWPSVYSWTPTGYSLLQYGDPLLNEYHQQWRQVAIFTGRTPDIYKVKVLPGNLFAWLITCIACTANNSHTSHLCIIYVRSYNIYTQ